MRSIPTFLLAAVLGLPHVAVAAPASARAPMQANKFNLKPGAEGKLCLDCHSDFEAILKRASVHTPVRSRNCTGCHNPHAAEHGSGECSTLTGYKVIRVIMKDGVLHKAPAV